MSEYTKHSVWEVRASGVVYVEAETKAESIERGAALLKEGEGLLTFTAELHEANIESAAP